MASGTRLGIFPPISEAPPTAKDLALDADLRRCLQALEVFESEAQELRRKEVYEAVNEHVRKWSVKLAADLNLPAQPAQASQSTAASSGGPERTHGAYAAQLVTFGSYHLQVNARSRGMLIVLILVCKSSPMLV